MLLNYNTADTLCLVCIRSDMQIFRLFICDTALTDLNKLQIFERHESIYC